MDPNTAWAELIQTTNDGELRERAGVLLDWLEKGGFPPHITGNQNYDITPFLDQMTAIGRMEKLDEKDSE